MEFLLSVLFVCVLVCATLVALAGFGALLLNGVWAIMDIREMGWKAYFTRPTHYTGPQ